jgi:hypothetical protein
MMFTGYSFFCYIIGLTILACTPLIQGEPWGPASNVRHLPLKTNKHKYHLGAKRTGPSHQIAVAYLAVFATGWAVFIYCSLMGYNAIDLNVETGEESSNDVISEAVSWKGQGSSA